MNRLCCFNGDPMFRFILHATLLLSVSLFADGGFTQGPSSVLSQPKKYNLSICAIFKNEGRYIKEWIEYHRLVGVDHFYLYSNNTSDRSLNVLKPYIKKGLITLVNWPGLFSDVSEEETYKWALSTQIAAYENAIHYKALNETKWLTIVDIMNSSFPFNR